MSQGEQARIALMEPSEALEEAQDDMLLLLSGSMHLTPEEESRLRLAVKLIRHARSAL